MSNFTREGLGIKMSEMDRKEEVITNLNNVVA
jgi:hypothetical protein